MEEIYTKRSTRANRALTIVPIVMLLLASLPERSWAYLQFCNKTPSKATVAIAYGEVDPPGTTTNGHRGVAVEGWWSIEPNQCQVVSQINAGDHWVYYYGHSSNGEWRGNSFLCVTSRRFTTGGQFRRSGDSCPAGYHLEGFRAIDTQKKNHTHNLTMR